MLALTPCGRAAADTEMQEVNLDQVGFFAWNIDTASVTGGVFTSQIFHPVDVAAVARSVTIKV